MNQPTSSSSLLRRTALAFVFPFITPVFFAAGVPANASLDPCQPPLSDKALEAISSMFDSRGYSPMMQAYLAGNTTLTPDQYCTLLAQDAAWRRLPPPPKSPAGSTVVRDGRVRVKFAAPWLAAGDDVGGLTPVVVNYDSQLVSAIPPGTPFKLWDSRNAGGYRSLVVKPEFSLPPAGTKPLPVPSWGNLVALGDATGDGTQDLPRPAGASKSPPRVNPFSTVSTAWMIAGGGPGDATPGGELILEVTVQLGPDFGGVRFTVLRDGKPVANQTVEIRTPDGKKYAVNAASGPKVWVFPAGSYLANPSGPGPQPFSVEAGAVATVTF